MSKKSILFVCLGNICRSPSAEAVMKAALDKKGLSDKYFVDSAGLTAFHAGDTADSRMQMHAQRRDYNLTSISRPVKATEDFNQFDYIIGMDAQNMRELNELAKIDGNRAKLSKMTDYCSQFTNNSVPDPYYGGAEGFELVLDLLEDACEGLISRLEDE